MIHYIGFYCSLASDCKKNVSPAAITKMNYVSRKLAEASNDNVHIFGIGHSLEKNTRYYPGKKYKINEKIDVQEITTFGRGNLFFKILGVLIARIQLQKYIFCNIKEGDIVVVYHTLFYKFDMCVFRYFKKNKVVMEVEELFAAAWGKDDFRSEIKYLSRFDGYIYVNDIMNSKFGFNKPFAVCYGDYSIRAFHQRKNNRVLIYAGVLGGRGSDVDLAIDIMSYLPDSYKLKIAGYGKDKDIDYVKMKIRDKKNIEFMGLLSGIEYENFLDQGDVGLCTRVLPNELSDYTFPSKVLVYLTHGLIPVCPTIDCIKKSKVSDAILFYEESTPEHIAKKILLPINNFSYDKLLNSLDCNLNKELTNLFTSFK